MKFSVLLPTRDRLDLLRNAIESVRRQDHGDWEIVVSDNVSAQDVGGYVASLGDSRIRYFRTDHFLPVTDNWNNALAKSRGDYVVMLGDDDSLLQGYFNKLSSLIEHYGQPEAVYVEAVQFAYPGVSPGHTKGFVQTSYSDLFRGRTEPFMIPHTEAVACVRKTMSLRFSFSYNMQHSVISRQLIDRLASRRALFQSPFPDYYATNVVMLEARQILAVPQAMIVIGISPLSFGYQYLNGRAEAGMVQLASFAEPFVPRSTLSKLLPGDPLLSSWYASMACVERDFGQVHHVRVDTGRYRRLQLAVGFKEFGIKVISRYWPSLGWNERVVLAAKLLLNRLPTTAIPERIRRRYDPAMGSESPWPAFDPQMRTVEYKTILELFEATPPVA
jgi:glycosyltransferase involved in cell wall biosynthesis